jgi:hypothetical protein
VFADVAPIVGAIAFVFDDFAAVQFNINRLNLASRDDCAEFVFSDFFDFADIAVFEVIIPASDDFVFD